MPIHPTDLNTVTVDAGALRSELAGIAMVTENDPRQGPAGSATAVELAWGTLRTQVLTALGTANVANVARGQLLIDRAPTLSMRGTP